MAAHTVLVVEDEPDIREVVTDVLSDEGYDVVGARDGAEGLRKARACHPSVVLLDLMMPGMNGWEFWAVHHGDPELRKIPVIVVSALGRVADLEADGFIQKPFEIDELVSTVRRHVPAA
jgi:CheY-like chemotaxis protein